MKKCRTLVDVIRVMNENFYSLVSETVETIGASGKRRTVLLFVSKFTRKDSGKDKQYLIGGNFKVDKYKKGKYYKIYRKLS